MVTGFDMGEYLESLRGLSADEIAECIGDLCPECLSVLCEYLIANPCEFEDVQISIPLYRYALFYANYFETCEWIIGGKIKWNKQNKQWIRTSDN